MKISLFDSPRSMVWQSALAICIGICTGFVLFTLICKPQAQAVSKGGFVPFFAQFGQPSAQLQILPKLEEKTYILLMGVDSNGKDADRFSGTRSDTMMLLSIDPILNKVGVVSIPRDSKVRIGHRLSDKINSAHAFGGPALAMQTVREAFGVPVDHYIVVDTQGLKSLFEILGPVQVLVEKEMHYVDHAAKLNVDLQPGLQTLSPIQAEEYVRFRHDARGDIGRIERQQWFLRQASSKFKEPQIILKLPQLVSLAYDCIRTDLTPDEILKLAAFAKDFPPEKVVTAMLPGEAQMINGGSYWVPDPQAGQALFNRVLCCSSAGFQQDLSVPPSIELTLPEDATVSNTAPGLTFSDKALSIAIKYPKSKELLSIALEKKLSQLGFRVRYRWLTPDAECQHQLIVQQSVRANEDSTTNMASLVPEMQSYPVSVAIEKRPLSDFTIVLSPSSQLPSLAENLNPTETKPVATSLINKQALPTN